MSVFRYKNIVLVLPHISAIESHTMTQSGCRKPYRILIYSGAKVISAFTFENEGERDEDFTFLTNRLTKYYCNGTV